MTRRVFDGARQERALRGLLTWSQRSLRTKSGKSLRDVAGELGMSLAQLSRYLSGATPLSSEQFRPFSEAFETSEAELIAACFPTVQPVRLPSQWSSRAAMEAAGLSPERIARVEQTIADWGELDQRDVVKHEIQSHQESLSESERHRSVS